MSNGRSNNEWVFFFHFNKPASKTAGRPRISVHYRGTCMIVDNVVVHVPCEGHHNKRQPYFVMKGRGVVRVSYGRKGVGFNAIPYSVAIIDKA